MNAKLLFLLVIILVSRETFSQWTRVSPNLLGEFQQDCCGFGCLHFKDGGLWAGRDELFFSGDSGITWSKVFTPPTIITEVNFLNRMHGVIATLDGVYRTTNGGTTWQRILKEINCLGAQYAGNVQRIVVAADGGGFFFTEDGGMSWDQQPADQHPHFVLGNQDGSAFGFSGSASSKRGNMYRRSSAGGDFVPSQEVDYDCFNAVRHHCSGKIFLMNEEGHIISDSIVSILVSSDEAQTWTPIFTRKPQRYFSAGMAVSPCCVVYCQTVAEGIVRSTDEGKTWSNIGGPSNAIDTRTVVAITDNMVLAIDVNGSIWRTINSGGDSLFIRSDRVLRFSSPSSAINTKPNADIFVPITVANAEPGVGFTLVAHYDTLAFTYHGSFATNGDRIDVASQSWPGRALLLFSPQDITTDSAVIGHSLFRVRWHEPFCDEVVFDSASSPASLCSSGIVGTMTQTLVGNYPGCLASVSEGNAEVYRDVRVRPNPSTGFFTINSDLPYDNVAIQVLDILGKVVLETVGDIALDRPVILDLAGEMTGTYYVKLQHQGSIKVISIVKK